MNAANLPTVLTLARLIAAPIAAGLILAANSLVLTAGADIATRFYAGALVVFVLAALTDAADGALARKLGVTSALGAALDHAADKALTVCTLVAMAATILSWDMVIAAILLIGRDVVIGGLREGLSLSGRALPVSQAGKLKTALILVAIAAALLAQTLLLAGVGAAQLSGLTPLNMLDQFARFALWAGVALSYWSAFFYVAAAAKRPQA